VARGGDDSRIITERVSQRVFQCRRACLPPSDREKTQMYLQRLHGAFHRGGEIVSAIGDGTNRAGVAHVMGFCTKDH